ncbi:MAG: right-handed parallel beta-helix repeat-containing protein [Pirellulales bacterium]
MSITSSILSGASIFGVEVTSSGALIASASEFTNNNTGVAVSNGSATVVGSKITANMNGVVIGAAGTASITGSNLSGNTTKAIGNAAASAVDASGNWWGSDDEFTVAAASTGLIDFTPFLTSGVDNDGGAVGFQGDTADLNVTTLGKQTGGVDRVQEGLDLVETAGSVNILAGTFTDTQQVVVSRDVTVVGAGRLATTLTKAFDTSSSGDGRGWWLVEPGIVLDLSAVTFDGSSNKTWQAIRHSGTGTIDDVAFDSILFDAFGPLSGSYTGSSAYAGTAVAAFGGVGAVDVTNSYFSDIGRQGVLYFGAGTTGTYSGNTHTGKGAGDHLDYAVEIGAGAVANILGNTLSDNLGVASTDGSTSAGVLATTYFGSGTSANVDGNNIVDSTSAIAVGYDDSDTSDIDVLNNTFSGNVRDVSVIGGVVDVIGNASFSAGGSAVEVSGGDVTVTDAIDGTTTAVSVSGGTVTLAGSSLTNNVTGVSVSGTGTLTVNSGNSISGGTTGILFDGPDAALTGLTLGDVSISGQSGDYITLANTAFDDLDIDATGTTLGGIDVSTATPAQLAALGDKITDEIDDNTLGQVLLQAGTIFVTPAITPTAADNDYTRIKNAVEAATAGDTIVLAENSLGDGTFNWDEANALASWKFGNDGIDDAGGGDDWTILLGAGQNDITVTAANLAIGDPDRIAIVGPGDVATANLEGVFVAYGNTTNTGWTFENFDILNFDNAIGFYYSGDDYSDLTVENMRIQVAADGSADANQNIGIHYGRGTNITIQDNLFELTGGGDGTSFAIQSNTHGGTNYDGLSITGNDIVVLNAGDENLYGIWENGHTHQSNISVSGNTFTGIAGNAGDQIAFRITSHSGASSTVEYNDNVVDQADVAFDWLDVYFGSPQDYTGTLPIQMDGNIVTNTGTAFDIGGINASANITGGSVTGSSGIGVAIADGNSATVSGVTLQNLDIGVLVGGSADLLGNIFDNANDNDVDVQLAPTASGISIDSANTFGGDTYFIENLSVLDVDLSSAVPTVDELANFRIEDKLFHAPDDSASGLVRIVGGALFVTTPGTGASDESIQRGVDAATGGDTVYVEAGTFTEQVSISKDITLEGQGAGATMIQSPTSLLNSFTYAGSTKQAVVTVESATATITALTVDGDGQGAAVTPGNDFVGIGIHNADALIDGVEVTAVRDNPLNGNQRGRAIFVGNDTGTHTVTVQNSDIKDYQKNGIDARGSGLTLNVLDNTITGAGDTTLIAQNGIVVLGGVDALIDGNTISGHMYSGVSGGSDPFTDTQSTGILTFDAGIVTVNDNDVDGNDIGVYAWGDMIDVTNNRLGLVSANRYEGILVDESNTSVTGNTIEGGNYGIAVISFSGASGDSSASITGNTITSATTGIWLRDEDAFDAATATASITGGNAISAATTGIDVDGSVALIENTDLTGNTIGIHVLNDGLVDAGDSAGGNVTGLGTGTGTAGSSAGGNILTGYDGVTTLVIDNDNLDAAGNVDVRAEGNDYGSAIPAVIETVVRHTIDDPALTEVFFSQAPSIPAATIVYVDDDWAGTPLGADADGAGGALGDGTAFGVDQFATISDAIAAVATGGTVLIYDGAYVENIDVNHKITLDGQSESGVVLSPISGAAVLTVSASGNSAIDRLLIRDITVTGATSNHGVWASGVDDIEFISVTALVNDYDGFHLSDIDDLVMTDVSAIGNGASSPATVGSGIGLNGVRDAVLTNVTATGNYSSGVGITARMTSTGNSSNIVIDGGTFSNESTRPEGTNGISLFVDDGYGASSISNVSIEGAVDISDHLFGGVTLFNADPSGASTISDIDIGQNVGDDVNFDSNVVGVVIFGNVSGVNVTADFSAGTTSGFAVPSSSGVGISGFDAIGTQSPSTVSLDGSSFTGYSLIAPAISLATPDALTPAPFGDVVATTSVSALNTTFDGVSVNSATTTQFFVIEDLVVHTQDVGAAGLVEYDPSGNHYVTTNSFVSGITTVEGAVQRGVDAATGGDTVYVELGTFTEQVSISKDITLEGQGAGATTIQSPTSLLNSFTYAGSTKQAVITVESATATITALTVDGDGQGAAVTPGNDFVGIGIHNADALIDGVEVTAVRDNPLNGNQRGRAIFVGNDTGTHTVTVQNSDIKDYQKNGIDARGSGLTLNVLDNTITGAGDTTLIAQNGIVVLGGVDALIDGNTISGHMYSGVSGGSDPFTDTQSTGILTFDAGIVTVNDNDVDGNDIGVYAWGDMIDVTNNRLGLVSANRYEGILVDESNTSVTGNTIEGGNYGIAVISFSGASGDSKRLDHWQHYHECHDGHLAAGRRRIRRRHSHRIHHRRKCDLRRNDRHRRRRKRRTHRKCRPDW